MAKQLLNDVFKMEKSVELLNSVAGGLTKAECAQIWVACQLHQVNSCGSGTSACTVYKKYCK